MISTKNKEVYFMRKFFICLFIIFVFPPINLNLSDTSYAQHKPIPSYAKWGRLAMEKTKQKYPNAQIIDYLHIGGKTGARTSTERFKLWLKEGQKEFGVFIDIEFNNQSENVIRITFKETTK
jgi:hypothetical protein